MTRAESPAPPGASSAPLATGTASPAAPPEPARAAPVSEPTPSLSTVLPADIPLYPNGSVTKTEADPNGGVLLLRTEKPWDELRDFYTAALVPAGWKVLGTAVPGQTLARFEKGERELVVQMQPGRQEEKLIRILWVTNSTPIP